MVEEECRRYRPTKNYLDHLPLPATSPFETPLMVNEFERIQNRLPMETLSMKRYELPPPPSGKLSEVSAWQEAIENSMAQLEHQWVRSLNLELMLDYGTEGGEHASTTAHVAEGSLAGTVGTTTTDTGNTGHSTSSSPGFGGGLVTYGNAKKNRIRLTAWRCYVQITHQPAR